MVHTAWPADAVSIAVKHIRFTTCKDSVRHYISFSQALVSAKTSGNTFTFEPLVKSNNGFYMVELPLTDSQRKHPTKGPMALAFEQGWQHQGNYQPSTYLNACLSLPLTGYLKGFKKYGFFVGGYINL